MQILRSARRAGFTLVETMAVICVAGILAAMAVPQIGKNAETVRLDKASSELRSLWRAQRRYWLERGFFAVTLKELELGGYVDGHFTAATDPYTYKVVPSKAFELTLEATRSGSGYWSGTLTLDEEGELSGKIQSKDGDVIKP